jgi:hypothetical protein
MKWFTYSLIFFNPFILLLNAQEFTVESWRDHLPYSQVNQLASIGDIYYASTPYSIIEFDNSTNEVRKLSTVNGLSEVGISAIEANQSQQSLLIAYSSSNIDLIKGGRIINISSILNSSIIGDKTVYNLYSHSKYVYVCLGFGIVVIDVEKEEIKDTYIVGDNNSQIAVLDLHISQDYIYALTNNKIKYAPVNSSFLSDATVWNTINTPIGTNFNNLESFGEDFFAFGATNVVHKYNNNNWDTIMNYPNENLRNFKVDNQNLISCTNSYVTIYNLNLDTLDFFFAYNGISGISPNDVIKGNGYYWIADESKGLRRLKNNFSLNKSLIGYGGPFTNECFHLSSAKNKLYVAAGRTYGSNWNKTFNWHGIYQFNNDWSYYNRITSPIMAQEIDTISDIVWVTANPLNENEFAASSFGGGLLLFNNNQFTDRFTFYNSSLQTRIGQSGK